MMSEPMSDERLVGFRRDVVSQVASAGGSTRHSDAYTEMLDEIDRLRAENERLESWVSDLQSGMYVNCVYCGHRYGPGETTPVSMADALKAHVEQCPQHPMSALKAEVDRWVGHYAALLITGLEIESAHKELRQAVATYIASVYPSLIA